MWPGGLCVLRSGGTGTNRSSPVPLVRADKVLCFTGGPGDAQAVWPCWIFSSGFPRPTRPGVLLASYCLVSPDRDQAVPPTAQSPPRTLTSAPCPAVVHQLAQLETSVVPSTAVLTKAPVLSCRGFALLGWVLGGREASSSVVVGGMEGRVDTG